MSQEKDKKTMPKPAGTSAPKKLEAKVAKTQEAVEQYYATYEAKGLEYRDLLAKNEDKSAIFHAKYAVKVAKFYYKIKILFKNLKIMTHHKITSASRLLFLIVLLVINTQSLHTRNSP